MGTFNILIYGFAIAVVALIFVVRKWKLYGKENIMVEVVRGGGSDSVIVYGKIVGNMLEIKPTKKYGFEVGKIYPFIADKEGKDGEVGIDKREAKEDDKDKTIGLNIEARTAIYPTTYPPGFPAILSVPIRKCVVDEDNWEMRTRYGSDPMMNPDLLVLYEHEKTMGLLVVLSQTIQEYEAKLQKALSRSVNPMVMYVAVAVMVCCIGYLIYQQAPLLQQLKDTQLRLDEVLTLIKGMFQ